MGKSNKDANLSKTLGYKIQYIRKYSKFTQEDIAKATGFAKRLSISNIERNITIPNVNFLEKFIKLVKPKVKYINLEILLDSTQTITNSIFEKDKSNSYDFVKNIDCSEDYYLMSKKVYNLANGEDILELFLNFSENVADYFNNAAKLSNYSKYLDLLKDKFKKAKAEQKIDTNAMQKKIDNLTARVDMLRYDTISSIINYTDTIVDMAKEKDTNY